MTEAAAGLAVLHATTQVTMCFRSKVLQEQGVHGDLEPNVQFANFALGEWPSR